jgi:hypothetical protein
MAWMLGKETHFSIIRESLMYATISQPYIPRLQRGRKFKKTNKNSILEEPYAALPLYVVS